MRSLRFEDKDLQRRFISALQESEPCLAYVVESDGAVSCEESGYSQVVDVAHTIRDSCFRWYFRWTEDPKWSAAFREELCRSGTPFLVEYHDRKMVFLLPKGGEQLHEQLFDRALETLHPGGYRE